MSTRNAKRFLIAVGLALLLPGMAGAAGFGPVQDSLWEAFVSRLWDGLVSVWTSGGPVDDPDGEGTNGGGSIDPNGGENGTGSDSGDGGGSIDPNG
jgi:hypothetical protein